LRKEPFFPAAELKKLKTVRWLKRDERLLQVPIQVTALAMERMEDAF